MALSLEKINNNLTKIISEEAASNQRAVQEGMAANEASKEFESHDTKNKENFSKHEPTEEDWDKIKKLQTRIETWQGYLNNLSTINPIAQDVLKAIKQAKFNLSELPKLPETEKIEKDLAELTTQYDNKTSEKKATNKSTEKQKTDEELIKKITDEIADMQK